MKTLCEWVDAIKEASPTTPDDEVLRIAMLALLFDYEEEF